MPLVASFYSENGWVFTVTDDNYAVVTAIPFPWFLYRRLLSVVVRSDWSFLGCRISWLSEIDPSAICVESPTTKSFLYCYEPESGFVIVLSTLPANEADYIKIATNSKSLLWFLSLLMSSNIEVNSFDFARERNWQSASVVNQ